MTRRATFLSSRGHNWLVELVKNLRLAWRLLRDPLVPAWFKFIPLGAVVYVLLPLDLIPDWMLGLGQLDDLGLFLLSLKLFFDLCPSELVQRHLAQMSSIEGSYRVVSEEQPPATDVAGYLDVDSHVLPDEMSSGGAEPLDTSSDKAP
jgi:uncharacterized membrane protein YkvA (DUF1232 family)